MATLRRPAAVLLALVMVALAFAVARTEPQEETGFAPFAVRVEPGQLGEGRGLQAGLDRALLADVVSLDDWTGETTGVWLVAEVRMATTENPSLAYATLHVGDRRWLASNRPGLGGMQSGPLDPGLPIAGTFVFEVPAELVDDPAAHHAVLRLADDGDTRLITVIEVELDLSALDHEPAHEIAPKERITW